MGIKDFFDKAENGVLTYEQFEAAVKAANAKFVDLSTGDYVSKHKYESDIAAKGSEIDTLNATISKRDADLATLKQQLDAAGADSQKLQDVSSTLESLQTKYNEDTAQFKKQLEKQAYEFAVREFANGKKFTSNAAKRDFVQSMIAKELKVENNSILGAEDFVSAYAKDNSDAFVQEAPADPSPKPEFVAPTPGGKAEDNPSPFTFNFSGVRAKQDK